MGNLSPVLRGTPAVVHLKRILPPQRSFVNTTGSIYIYFRTIPHYHYLLIVKPKIKKWNVYARCFSVFALAFWLEIRYKYYWDMMYILCHHICVRPDAGAHHIGFIAVYSFLKQFYGKGLYRGKIIIFLRKGLHMARISENGIKTICEICDRYANEKTPLMMILSDIQKEYGYIPLDVQEIVSQKTGISVAEIFGVVTFYSFFSLKPKGKYIIGCCLGTACYVKGAQQIIDKFSDILGIKPGETTEDCLFTLDALRCLGACGIAPAVSINGKVYPKVTVDQVQGIVNDLKEAAAK